MKSDTNKQSNGAEFVALLIIIFLFFTNPSKLVSESVQDKSTPTSENLYFHVARFYGADVTPTKTILDEEIEKAADEFGLKRSVFKALVKVESGGNPRALSPVGARGVAQIMPFNARRCGLSSAEKLWDAILNLRCGAQILSEEVQEHGDYHKALTVYNCGKVHCSAGKLYANKVLSIAKRLS
ncbi:LT_GEWL domain containing protein [uncultured Caudovirales phage]|uniref:LT_GEWL domain containing protein n=1 Tax=uncultured Caudovirales phage TaxID=2100421 RepID=A0A6J5M385_9CAUD|nr:LT_GEWL domain containing protein [uncultured Caudovirales phage]